jgi:AcrR family transcriptional regulator
MVMVTQREHTEVRQKQIVSAARRLITKYGSEHVTVRRMATEIGVTEGAIYRHFKSKSDILAFLISDIEDTLITDIEANFKGRLTTLETLENIIIAHLSSIEQRKGVSFQVIAEILSLGDKKLNKQVRLTIEKYLDRIKTMIASGIKEGIIRQDTDVDAAAIMFFGMTQSLVNIWALSQYEFNLLKRYKPLWEVYLKAISATKKSD